MKLTDNMKTNNMKDQITIISDDLNHDIISEEQAREKLIEILGLSDWVAYNWNDISTRPKKYDKYFVRRKDGKVHWETWNGNGWAYNEKVITHYQEVKFPEEIFKK